MRRRTLRGFCGCPWLMIAAGLCYNSGRVFAATGALIVGAISAAAGGSSRSLRAILAWVARAALLAARLARWVRVETRARALAS